MFLNIISFSLEDSFILSTFRHWLILVQPSGVHVIFELQPHLSVGTKPVLAMHLLAI